MQLFKVKKKMNNYKKHIDDLELISESFAKDFATEIKPLFESLIKKSKTYETGFDKLLIQNNMQYKK